MFKINYLSNEIKSRPVTSMVNTSYRKSRLFERQSAFLDDHEREKWQF